MERAIRVGGQTVVNSIQDVASVAGILLGAVLLLAVSWVWLRKQVLGTSGIALTLVGFALVGLTVWTSIRMEATPEGFIAEFEQRLNELNDMVDEMDADVRRVATTSLEVSDDIEDLRSTVATNGRQFQVLTMELERGRMIPETELDRIREGVAIPQVGVESQEIRRRRLDEIINR